MIRHGVATLTPEEKKGWHELFLSCFKKDEASAASVFEKYMLHPADSVFCFGLVDGQIVACYAGIVLTMGDDDTNIFLATDTMSSGLLKNATVKLGKHLYSYLRNNDVKVVCGFPNENIIKIREKKLGWKMVGKLNPYFGIPLIWRFLRNSNNELQPWCLTRPSNGYYVKNYPGIRLLGRSGLYGGKWLSLVFTLASKSPGHFFVKVPTFLLQPKIFGYVLLDESDTDTRTMVEKAVNYLDLNTIDVP